MAKLLLSTEGLKADHIRINDFCDEVRSNSSYFDASRVVKLVHYKKLGSVEHEYLVGDILHDKVTYRLCMERGRGIANHWWDTASSLAPAKDQISRWDPKLDPMEKGKGNGKNKQSDKEPLEISIFRTLEPFALRDLCLILQFVPTMAPQYDVKRYQCYWFCWAVLELLKNELDGVRLLKGKDFDVGGTYARTVPVLNREDAKERLKKFRESQNAKQIDSAKAVGSTFQLAMTNQQVTKQNLDSRSAIETLFSFHSHNQERTKRTAKRTLDAIARRAEEEAAWDAAVERMSPLDRAFAKAERNASAFDEDSYETRKKGMQPAFDPWDRRGDDPQNGESPPKRMAAAII